MRQILGALLSILLTLVGSTARAQVTGSPLIGDFNGNGIADLATWSSSDKKWHILLGCGHGFQSAVAWDGMSATDGKPFAVDLNGDGKTDIIMWNDASKQWSVNISTGKGFKPDRWPGMWGTDGQILFGDLNGDRKTDIVMWNDASKMWSVNISTGKGFKADRWPGMWGTDGEIHLGDFNGDGKTDIIMWNDASKLWSVNISTGKGFKPDRWPGMWGTDGEIHLGDLNGDRKTDIVMWNDASKLWSVNISTGKGFKANRWPGAWGSDGPVNVADLDGDGKSDLFMWRAADAVWTVNRSTGKGFKADIWNGGSGAGMIYARDLDHDKKADVLVWQPGQTVWTVNLSTGHGWTAVKWQEEPHAPVLTQFEIDPKPLAKGDPVVVDYAFDVPAECTMIWYMYLADAKGYASETITTGTAASGSFALASGYTYPLHLVMQAYCQNAGCPNYAPAQGFIAVDGPPALKIASFTASGGGRSASAFHRGDLLYVPVGTPVTLTWSVADCGPGCNVALQGWSGTIQTGSSIFVKNGLPTSGSYTFPPTDTQTTYFLTASDNGEAIQSAHVEVDLAPLPPTDPCAGNQCTYFYFQLNSPPDAITSECFVVPEYAKDEPTAQAKAQATQASNYSIKQITGDQYLQGCS